jgi:hypothetical protein
VSALHIARWALAVAGVAAFPGGGDLLLLALALLGRVHAAVALTAGGRRGRIERLQDIVFSLTLCIPTGILGLVVIAALVGGLRALAGEWGRPTLVASLVGAAAGAVVASVSGRSGNRLRGPIGLV